MHHKHFSDETGGNRDGHWEKPVSFNFEEFLRGGEGKWGKYTSDIALDWTRLPWKNIDISCMETPQRTAKILEKIRLIGARYEGFMKQVTVLPWISGMFSLIPSHHWRLESSSCIHIWPKNILTSTAVPRGHFAPPGLSDGGTGYCVLGWFLYDVPCPGLQTPFITTGFVSLSAGSPFAPLAHFTAFYRDTRDQGYEVKTESSVTQRSNTSERCVLFDWVL